MDLQILLSKILPLLIYPLNVSLWLIIVGALCLWRGRTLLSSLAICAAIALLWTSATPVFAEFLAARLERQYLPMAVEESPQADAIVVLSGGLGLVIPPRREVDLRASADRILHTARLYRAGKAPWVIATGGNVFPQHSAQPESVYATAILQEWGVDKNAILTELNSRNTYENAVETAKLLQKRQLGTVLLVTSAMHMPRALATFRSAGIDAIASPTDYRVAQYQQPLILKWLPSAGALCGTTNSLKEYLGTAVYRWRGWIRSQ